MHHIIINHAYAIVCKKLAVFALPVAVVFAMLAMNMSNPKHMLVHLDYFWQLNLFHLITGSYWQLHN